MIKPSRAYFLLFVAACSIAASAYYYDSRCHGVDECAAQAAESHEKGHTARTSLIQAI
jgi:hypothetical protein